MHVLRSAARASKIHVEILVEQALPCLHDDAAAAVTSGKKFRPGRTRISENLDRSLNEAFKPVNILDSDSIFLDSPTRWTTTLHMSHVYLYYYSIRELWYFRAARKLLSTFKGPIKRRRLKHSINRRPRTNEVFLEARGRPDLRIGISPSSKNHVFRLGRWTATN